MIAALLAALAAAPAHAAPGEGLTGALQGGSWSHSVPLELPAAPAGMVPGLELVHDFRAPDDLLGPGWSLAELSRIERHGLNGAPVPAFDITDTFTVDGQLLWEDSGYFHAEQDDERYFSYAGASNEWVARRDGWTWVYGGFTEGADGCAVETLVDRAAHPCDARVYTPTFDETTAWLLASVEDPWGNTIEITYASLASIDADTGRLGGAFEYAHQHVPRYVSYASGQHLVELDYNSREDARVDARSTVARVLAGRLEAITVWSQGGSTSAGWDAGARYEIVYDDEDPSSCDTATERTSWSAETASAGTGETILHRILRVPDGGLTGAAGGKSLRCATTAGEDDTWPAESAISMAFDEGGSWVTDRGFDEVTFLAHQVVNFDGGPAPELLEMSFPVCEPDVAVTRGYTLDMTPTEAPGIGGGVVRPRGPMGPASPAAIYEITGCARVDTSASLVAVDADGATLSPTSHGVLDEAMAEVATADPSDPVALVFLDIDRDGQTDAIVAHTALDAVLFRSEPDGSVRRDILVLDYASVGAEDPADLLLESVIADIDGDGLVDLVHEDGWFRNWGSGDYWSYYSGAVTLPFTTETYFPLAAIAALGDVNGDGLADITVAASERCNPDSETDCLDPDDGVWLGTGNGDFIEAGDPGLDPVDEGGWTTWTGVTSDGSPNPEYWAAEVTWAWADVDGDGEIEVLDAVDDGLPYPLLLAMTGQGEPVPYAQVLADWNADGATDVLYIEGPADIDLPTGTATLFPGTRTVADTRLTALQTAWGGEYAVNYGRSSDEGRNAQLPWPVDVVASVTGPDGTTTLAFDGAVWWPEHGRFMGFRDALVTREDGGSTHVRFATSPWAGGREVYRSEWRADGTMQHFVYESARDPGAGALYLDLEAPFFNPVREQCVATLGPGDSTGAQSVDEADLVSQCECSFQAPVSAPPPNQPPQGPPPEGQPPPLGPPLPPEGPGSPPPCSDVDASLFFEVHGWGVPFEDWGEGTNGAEYGVWRLDGPPSYTFTGGTSVASASWHPDIPAPGRSAYPATSTALPADLYEPGATPPSRVESGPTAVVMTAQSWHFDESTHRRTGNAWMGDVDIAGDERMTSLVWESWQVPWMGARLSRRTTWAASFSGDRLEETYTYGSGYAEVLAVSQRRDGSAWPSASTRAWSQEWNAGEVVEETDADGVTTTYARNACGQVTTRQVGARPVESWTYTPACEKSTWSFLSGSASWTYDDYGRVETVTTDPGGPSATTVETWFREGNWAAVERGDGTASAVGLRAVELDAWGREQAETACESDGAAVPGCIPGTAARVERGWAADGTLRFTTTPFDPDLASPPTLSATWSYRDELGREERGRLPAPSVDQDYVATETAYLPGEIGQVDPGGVECWTEFDSLATSTACAGVDRGSETRDAWGRTTAVTSPLGIVTELGYDAFDRLAATVIDSPVAFVDGTTYPSETYTWTSAGRPESRTDNAGVVTTWSYDSTGRLDDEVVDGPSMPPVTTRSMLYLPITSSGETVMATAETDLDGNVTWSLADALDRSFSVTLPGGATAWWARDTRGFVSSRQDFDGIETEYYRDGRGFVAEETLVPLSASRSYVRDAAGRVTQYTDRDDVVTEAVFTRAGLPDTITRPRASAADWTLAWYLYEDDGLPSMASEGGVTRAFSYDTLRRLSWACDGYASGGCARDTQFTYDDEDRVTTATIYAGGSTLATSFQYDDIGNLVGVTHPGGSTETWGYTRAGQVGAHLDEEMVGSAWGYDDLGRMAWEDLPGQDPRSWSYTQGVPSGTSGVYYTETRRDEPDGGSWFTLHDFAGRAVYDEDPYGDAVTREYSGTRLEHAYWTSSTGTTLAHEAYGYDAAGRLAYRLGPVDDATYAALGSATPDPAAGDYAFAYAYTDEGNLRSREGPNDLTEWGWADGVVTSEDAAGVTATTYAYDPDFPRLYSRSAGDGASNARVTTYARDALGRLESATTADGSQEVVASWLDRDAYGRPRLSRREVDGVVESARTVTTDPRGRVSTLALATPTRSAGVSYQYYDNGQLYAMEAGWSGGGSASLTYTRAGADLDLAAIRDNGSGLNVATFSARDDLGRATQVDLGTGAQVRTEWDLRGRVEWRDVRNALGDYRAYTYAYDTRGRVENVLAETASTFWTRQYDYLEPGFLEREVLTTSTGVTTTEYVPDAAFNRASRTVTSSIGSTTTTYGYGYGNVLSSVDGQPVDWNAFGETVTDHRGWDIDRAADGAEVALADSLGTAAHGFTRGPGGEAIEVEDLGTGDLRSFLWGPSEADFPVGILDESGTDHLYVAAEGMVLGRLEGGAFTPMGQDGQGSVVLDGIDLLPEPGAFGETPAPASPERRVYALLESLPGTSYHLPRRRLYDSDTGRFASADPIGLLGGDNRFAYLSGNPLSGVDPSGLYEEDGPTTTTSGGSGDDGGSPPEGGTTRGGRGWFCPSGGSGLQCGVVVGATGEGTTPAAGTGDTPEGAEPSEDPETAQAEGETDAGEKKSTYYGKDPSQPGCVNCNMAVLGTPGAIEDGGAPEEPITHPDYENDTLDEGTPPEDDVAENPEAGSQQPVDDDGGPGGGTGPEDSGMYTVEVVGHLTPDGIVVDELGDPVWVGPGDPPPQPPRNLAYDEYGQRLVDGRPVSGYYAATHILGSALLGEAYNKPVGTGPYAGISPMEHVDSRASWVVPESSDAAVLEALGGGVANDALPLVLKNSRKMKPGKWLDILRRTWMKVRNNGHHLIPKFLGGADEAANPMQVEARVHQAYHSRVSELLAERGLGPPGRGSAGYKQWRPWLDSTGDEGRQQIAQVLRDAAADIDRAEGTAIGPALEAALAAEGW